MSSIPDAMKRRVLRVRPTKAIDQHIAKALGNSLRVQILWILNERVASPSELAKELAEPLNRISNHIKVLRDADCVELDKQVIVGNSVQRFYRATARVFLDDTEWPAVPATVQEGLRTTLLHNLMDDAIEAVSQGTYDAYEDSHMSWTPMIVDDQGREELTQIFEDSLYRALAVQAGARERLSATNTAGISYSVSILAYPSIGGKKKVVPTKGANQLAKSTERRPAKVKKAAKKKASTKKAKPTAKGRAGKATAKPKRKAAGN